ncbi:winged helix-turn-helix domain-containing protein [Paenibacillus caseinilyticus]|uniref:Transcriptional regulator n=1 Tax=Paenibacillus mucilaginosus K02 TaxID=997761 RepID=I0BDE4_9BACL|nr:response regulator transcription factor [Paenibacillus mucilaginosus]AFH60391.1 transcriptional regulator [Paenibacillus mucilaginosus K02]
MICEDDTKLSELLQSHMQRYGFQSVIVEDFGQVLGQFQRSAPHLVLLDVNLPQYDGFYWCRQIRSVSTCPIIFISARSGGMDQVMALEYGADDYITKPLQIEVLIAKIRSQLRRVYGEYAAQTEEKIVQKAGLTLYPERLELHGGEQSVVLTKKEAVLLEALMRQHPRVTAREELLELLWDEQTYVDENTLNVNVARARKKLLELGVPDGIETIRGAGYRLQERIGSGTPSAGGTQERSMNKPSGGDLA